MPGPVIRPQALPAGEPAGWHRPGWRWILPGLILVVAATGAQRHSGLPVWHHAGCGHRHGQGDPHRTGHQSAGERGHRQRGHDHRGRARLHHEPVKLPVQTHRFARVI